MAKKKRKMGNIYGIVFLIISVFLIYTLYAKVQHIQAEKATYQKLVVQKNELKKEKKKYIPPMDHPWKKASFANYAAKQKHRCGANV